MMSFEFHYMYYRFQKAVPLAKKIRIKHKPKYGYLYLDPPLDKSNQTGLALPTDTSVDTYIHLYISQSR